VAAAGNGGREGKPLFPAAWNDVIAVTATDADNELFIYATRGTFIALAAPGYGILSTQPQDRFRSFSGTSMAAAHVSGVVALLLEVKRALSPRAIKQCLETTAKDLGDPGRDSLFGSGLVDAYKAVQAARDSAPDCQ